MRLAVEKEPLTLEKVNEDQSNYLNYPKLPVLDMKRENHAINVVEWANISKFPPLLTQQRLGENIVLRPIECLTPTAKFDIFHICSSADPPWSQQHSSKRCTQQRKCTIIGNKQLQKKERGHFEQRTLSKKQCNFDSGQLEQQQDGLQSFF